jgi:two-component system NtrC family sensor kinase
MDRVSGGAPDRSKQRQSLVVKAEGPIDRIMPTDLYRHFEDFPDPVVVADSRSRLVYLNRAAEQLLGYSGPLAAPYPPCDEVIPYDGKEGNHCFIDLTLRGRENLHRHSARIVTARGEKLRFSVSSTLLRDSGGEIIGCLAVLSDVQDDLPAPPQVKPGTMTLSSLLKHYPLPFFTVDPSLMITYMNEHLEKLSGFTREQAVGKMKCSEVLRTKQCDTCDCLLRKSMIDMVPISGMRRVVVDHEGREVPVVAYASILTDDTGVVTGGFEAIRDITHIVEAEEKINLLTEMSQEGILMVDENCLITFANAKMCEMTGLSKEELTGRDVAEVLPPHYAERIAAMLQHADARHYDRIRFCSTLSFGNRPVEYGERTFETSMATSRVGNSNIAFLYLRDLTERIEIVRQLRKANSFLNNIIQSTADGIVVVDTKGNVLVFNEAAERILGYKAEEVIGYHELLRKICEPELARELMRRLRSDQYGPPGKLESTRIVFRSKDGEDVPVSYSAGIIKEGNREVGSVGIFFDLRDHLRMHEELEQARLEVLQAEKIASLGRLAAGVAHEINNPLAGILIYADLLLKEVGHNPSWRQDMEEIITQTLRCKEIVNRLLEFSRRSLAETVLFNVNEVIAQGVKLLSRQTLFQDIQILQDLDPRLPYIVGDPGQIRQVLTNLMINAADAMNGKGRLTISSRFDPDQEQVVLRIADTGPGIDPDTVTKIFEPFFTTKPPGKGTGLGLSIAYGIIQRHGGTIDVDSLPGEGTTFVLTLPIDTEDTAKDELEAPADDCSCNA